MEYGTGVRGNPPDKQAPPLDLSLLSLFLRTVRKGPGVSGKPGMTETIFWLLWENMKTRE